MLLSISTLPSEFESSTDPRERVAAFLTHAESLVDDLLDPSTAETEVFPRFVRVAPVRFGRIRLFLAKFLGRVAWRNGVNL